VSIVGHTCLSRVTPCRPKRFYALTSKQLLADTVSMRPILMRTLTMVAPAAAGQDIADACRRFAAIVAGRLLGTAAVRGSRGAGTP
jgi:hypothetical protein